MAALDLLGRRWALRILWELRREPIGARLLLDRCPGLSSSVLYQRLRELVDAGLIARAERELYTLTDLGGALGRAMQPLDSWANRWADTSRAPSGRTSKGRSSPR
jgi:DNA-binding HxlR family transcriptional regulator